MPFEPPPWCWAWPASGVGPEGLPLPDLHLRDPWALAPWAEAWERLGHLALAEAFARWAPCPGLGPEAYRSRLLEVQGCPALLAGIRFRGGDLAWPFVELWPREGLAAGGAWWAEALAVVARAFAPFAPQAARFHHPPEAPPPVPGARLDQAWWWGQAHQAAATPTAPALKGLTLGPARDLSWYPQAEAAHARFQAQGPAWRYQVRLEAPEALQEALARGSLVVAKGPQGWLGVAAALPEPALGQAQAWLVIEELVAPEAMGRGLGRALQRQLAASLPPEAWLWGTILAENLPSQAVARACGRRPLIAATYLPLPPGRSAGEAGSGKR